MDELGVALFQETSILISKNTVIMGIIIDSIIYRNITKISVANDGKYIPSGDLT